MVVVEVVVVVVLSRFLRIALKGRKGLLKSEIFSLLSSSSSDFFSEETSSSISSLSTTSVSSLTALLLGFFLLLPMFSKAGILMSGNLAMGLKNGGLALLGGLLVVSASVVVSSLASVVVGCSVSCWLLTSVVMSDSVSKMT